MPWPNSPLEVPLEEAPDPPPEDEPPPDEEPPPEDEPEWPAPVACDRDERPLSELRAAVSGSAYSLLAGEPGSM
jgi:hypothetical protein